MKKKNNKKITNYKMSTFLLLTFKYSIILYIQKKKLIDYTYQSSSDEKFVKQAN